MPNDLCPEFLFPSGMLLQLLYLGSLNRCLNNWRAVSYPNFALELTLPLEFLASFQNKSTASLFAATPSATLNTPFAVTGNESPVPVERSLEDWEAQHIACIDHLEGPNKILTCLDLICVVCYMQQLRQVRSKLERDIETYKKQEGELQEKCKASKKGREDSVSGPFNLKGWSRVKRFIEEWIHSPFHCHIHVVWLALSGQLLVCVMWCELENPLCWRQVIYVPAQDLNILSIGYAFVQ